MQCVCVLHVQTYIGMLCCYTCGVTGASVGAVQQWYALVEPAPCGGDGRFSKEEFKGLYKGVEGLIQKGLRVSMEGPTLEGAPLWTGAYGVLGLH